MKPCIDWYARCGSPIWQLATDLPAVLEQQQLWCGRDWKSFIWTDSHGDAEGNHHIAMAPNPEFHWNSPSIIACNRQYLNGKTTKNNFNMFWGHQMAAHQMNRSKIEWTANTVALCAATYSCVFSVTSEMFRFGPSHSCRVKRDEQASRR